MIHCTKCFEVQPDNSNHFPVNKKVKRGLASQCKGCTQDYKKEYRKKNIDILKKKRKELYESEKEEAKEASRIYRLNNKDKVAAWSRKHYEKNTEKMKRRSSLYYSENKEYVRIRGEEYRKKNAEWINERKRRYYEENKTMITARNKRWRSNNIEKVRRISVRYEQRKRSKFHDYKEEYWDYALNFFSHSCAYCGAKERMEQEHIIPVSKGGPYIASNIIPACRSCNASKGDKDLEMWYRSHKSFNCERLERVYQYIEGVQTIERSKRILEPNKIYEPRDTIPCGRAQ